MKTFATLVGVFITLPLWFVLLYKILVLVNATELMWFLYWVYVPFSLFVSFALKLLEK